MTAPRLTWTTFAAPMRLYGLAGRLTPWAWVLTLLFGLPGVLLALGVVPTDAQQGDSYRILFIHVPAAWLSMVLYLAIALWAGLGWVLRVRSAALLARAIAPTGALFTAVALWTGALWGQPTWGTWWVWDARLTSELILLFLYLGYIALVEAIDDPRRAAEAGALLALVGAINIPVIYFSVRWWNTLHQGASISMTAAPSMARQMLWALALCTLSAWAYAFAVIFTRLRALLIEHEHEARWVEDLAAPTAAQAHAHADVHPADPLTASDPEAR